MYSQSLCKTQRLYFSYLSTKAICMKQCYIFLVSVLAIVVLSVQGSYAQCTDPMPSVINITNDSVTVSWPAVTGAAGYEYAVQLASLPQPSSGTPTNNTTIGVNNLPFAAHKAWVRTDCGSSTFSNWVSISFTIVCSKPGTITITNVTDTSADINWSQVPGISSYEYVLDTISADPAGTGTQITTTSYHATGLQPGKDYYMHVLSECGSGGTLSAWTTEHFTTQYPVSVPTTSNVQIHVYPNPVKDVLHVRLAEGKGKVTVFDIRGRAIRNIEVTESTTDIDMQSLNSGIYILKYTDGESQVHTRFFKQ